MELGFSKYAYDWNIENLDSMAQEFSLAKEHNIEIIAVWFWLNAKRDSIEALHDSNRRMLQIVEEAGLKTTFWVSFNNNFFEHKTQEEAVGLAAAMIAKIYKKAAAIGCKVALYNHRGWFGDPDNQLAVINRLSELDLGIVYNFHHAHHYVDNFPELADKIMPYLVNVNLNGMRAGGPEILPLGSGDLERGMIEVLREKGFNGPWGILGHVKNQDVNIVLRENIEGYRELILE
jgi:sugar phosphate isomerase/epimerase